MMKNMDRYDKGISIERLGWGRKVAELGLAVLIVGIPGSIFSSEIGKGIRYLAGRQEYRTKVQQERNYVPATQPYAELADAGKRN